MISVKKITVVQPRPVEQQKYDFMAVTDTKSYFHTKGITGVFTYDIGDIRLFIYYSTSHFRYNTFNFHWDDHGRPAKEDLFQQMSHKKDIRSSKETVTWHSKENLLKQMVLSPRVIPLSYISLYVIRHFISHVIVKSLVLSQGMVFSQVIWKSHVIEKKSCDQSCDCDKTCDYDYV